jgi:hypothetical protein
MVDAARADGPHDAGEAKRVESLLVKREVLQAQRTCSPVITLPLPKRSWARRTPSTPSIDEIAPRMYSTEPTSSFGPVPWPFACTMSSTSLTNFELRSAPCCIVTAL